MMRIKKYPISIIGKIWRGLRSGNNFLTFPGEHKSKNNCFFVKF